MAITPINNTQSITTHKKSPLVKITGYGALASGILCGVAANNKNIKLHTKLAYLAGILAVTHTALVEWFHHQKNKSNKT